MSQNDYKYNCQKMFNDIALKYTENSKLPLHFGSGWNYLSEQEFIEVTHHA